MDLTSTSHRRKAGKNYIYFRIYAVVVVVAWNAIGIWEFARAAGTSEPPILIWFLVPFLIPALFMCFNLSAFRFNYSIFGSLERTRPSGDPVLEEVRSTGGIVGWLHATTPFFTWKAHTTGVSFYILGVGNGFVDFSHFTSVKKRLFFGCSISHSSPEVRSPLVIYDKRICARIAQLSSQKGIQCDIIPK